MFKRIFSTFKHIPLRIWWPLATITPVLIFNRKHVFCQNKDSFINKFDIINILSSSKEEIVFVVCNRESINQLSTEITKIKQECQNIGIKKIVLVDQTDVRHIQGFERWIKNKQKDESQEEPHNLQGKLYIFYINPNFQTSKPFRIQQNKVNLEIREIRSWLTINPSKQKLKQNLQTFNKTTIVKTCFNEGCLNDLKQNIRNLVEVDLLKGKSQNFSFFVTTGKNQLSKISQLIPNSGKEETFAFRNDVLGKQTSVYSDWIKNRNSKAKNKFFHFVKPRVHIINPQSFENDLYWYITSIMENNIFSFSINNVLQNGNQEDIELLKKLKQQYQQKLQLVILNTTAISQLLRHVVAPWKYVVFQMSRQVPYPKRQLKEQNMFEQIDDFMKNKDNLSMIKLYKQKQIQINAVDLPQMVKDRRQKWILRVCKKNSCLKSAYELYGIDLRLKVYTIDKETQNIDLNIGDYEIENGNIQPIN